MYIHSRARTCRNVCTTHAAVKENTIEDGNAHAKASQPSRLICFGRCAHNITKALQADRSSNRFIV